MDAKRAREAEKVYARILKDIKPSKLEVQATIANSNRIMARLKKIVPKSVELMVVGSIARSTNLRGDSDIDIFMLFDKKVPEKIMEQQGLGFARRMVNKKKGERFEVKYAEHPYARLHLDDVGMKVDVVPAYKISKIEELATAVDRTPLHTKFMNSHLSERQRDEVRLLKYLLKMHLIYGAEVKVKGFSGYLCELLIFSFGSLTNLLEMAQRFRLPLYIDPLKKEAKGDKEVFKKFNSEFIVIDPVDKNRNVAAGVSLESLARFVFVAGEFVSKPSAQIFFGQGFSSTTAHRKIQELVKKSHLESYLIVGRVPGKSEDVVWPQLSKAAGIIVDQVRRAGFQVYLSTAWIDKSNGFIMIIAPHQRLSTRLFEGPSVLHNYNAASSFVKAHKDAIGIVMDKERIRVLDSNRYENIEQIMKEVVSGKLLDSRKDVNLKKAKLYVNSVPKEYSESAYAELNSKLVI
ncbi:MAG: CCA tRNA nucleotidyltransferase [Candidatus Micrarchaeota archaeon]|nr:CCA tRNA nucleotidyltransferase [Candidatus Micrarchaeota archaeon]MDE1848348.1 CCA tRNA nucleotidyltransferase [Candidatus Micrarchaeota archaeon]MDE1864802.1 CCA tRNA nucleotidyltransferase [Candidatus Micrarchaeota archaeon]